MLRQFIFLIFAVLVFQVDVFAEELVAQDELQIAITEMNWASNDQFFLLNNNKTVVVYDSNSLEILDTYKNYNFFHYFLLSFVIGIFRKILDFSFEIW